MAILVFISVDDGCKKINAIKAWRYVVGIDSQAYGLSEAKSFIETNHARGHVQVLFSDAQFGRFVLMCGTDCSGGVDQPFFSYHSAKPATTASYDFTR